MQIDKNMINSLLSYPDDKLIMLIKTLSASAGISIPSEISKEDIAKLKSAVSSLDSLDTADIGTLLAKQGIQWKI